VNALSSNPESLCNLGYSTGFVEKPAHFEGGGREEVSPFNVTELRLQRPVRFNDWMVRDTDFPLVVGPTAFDQEPRDQQVIEHLVDVCL